MLPPLRSLAIFFSFVASLVACSATGKIDCEGYLYYNPDAFTPDQKTWIEESSERWNTWVGHRVMTVRPGHSDVCYIDMGKIEAPHIGQTYITKGNSDVITIDRDYANTNDRARFESVVMHEMGHSIGYKHISGGPAMMAPSSALDFTDLDRVECIRRQMCFTLSPNEYILNGPQ